MSILRVTSLQNNIEWEEKEKNLLLTRDRLALLSGNTDLVILPEMFTTGFSMQSAQLAETMQENTIHCIQEWATSFEIAIVGSFIAKENGHFYNRAFFVTPKGERYHYDKHHLFRMGLEGEHFDAGNQRLIVPYKGWNICIMVCYDLRFPVWCRTQNNDYELLIFTANWPDARLHVWDTLLKARAIENAAYVCGCNRIGTDGMDLHYTGHSTHIDPKGNIITVAQDNKIDAITSSLDLSNVLLLRERFPVWKDADPFIITTPL